MLIEYFKLKHVIITKYMIHVFLLENIFINNTDHYQYGMSKVES